MSPIQQMLLGVGAVDTKTYVDDVFSTFLYNGTGSSHLLNSGIDLLAEGGLVWSKRRNGAYSHVLIDTVRGADKYVLSNTDGNQQTIASSAPSFNNNGFTVNSSRNDLNNSSGTYSSWQFRKAPGWFTIKEYTGTGSTQSISHDLGSIPGAIFIKCTSNSYNWAVYHRGANGGTNPWDYRLSLDRDVAESATDLFGDTAPTNSAFTVGTGEETNNNGATYIAYIFAGGESTAANAYSVSLDGTGNINNTDYLWTDESSNYTPGTSDFTLEYWFNQDSGDTQALVEGDVTNQWGTYTTAAGLHKYRTLNTDRLTSTSTLALGQWHHVAIVRSSGTTRMYINGIQEGGTYSDTTDYTFDRILIGLRVDGSYDFGGKISNVRFVVGTAVYTSSFRPPTEPLTNITNTKLLCCNTAASAWSGNNTSATVGTVTAFQGAAASSDSPFDDPAGFVFGDAGDQNVIKCGSYRGSGSAGLEINLGFEPQFLIIKRSNATKNWTMFDNMRGIATDGNDAFLYPNLSDTESATGDQLDLTPTGFKIKVTGAILNGSGDTYIWMAIRRPDGYVGKPPELGTGVFAMDTGNGSNTIPAFDSGFPVDFGIKKAPASSGDWNASTRLTGLKVVKTNTDGAESTSTTFVYDSNVGYAKSQDSTDQGWMWKRHAGFDVVAYPISSSGGIKHVTHNLSKVPEMIFMKDRDNSDPFVVYHKGLNGGTNPKDYYLTLNSNNSESNLSNFWGNSASDINATSFYIDQQYRYTGNHIAMLFASVDGISKCGTYDGSGSTGNAQNIGFQPRFLLIKRISSTGDWMQFNSVGGFGNYMQLNTNQQQNSQTYVNVSSTGFSLVSDYGDTNESGSSYIYYAHA